VTAGVSWQAHKNWRVALQVDWVDWSSAFRQLPVHLRNGNNAAINAAVGSNAMDDFVPLNWRDTFDYRAGVEYSATEKLKLRTGYRYGRSPVPDQTLLPLTALINEHVFTTGAGYDWGRWRLDFAYQWELPASRSVGTSGLLSGEYSNSRTEVSIHTLALTASMRF
jgi:long-chain fatty acid transport protein